ncbi:MAG: CRISPR-associated RAMP protein Csx10 [Pirellulaceae bacterium]|nr:MAG: CRISPR-associated RAMP protein Csx10 [Pirellulaceae bacterium]
MKRYNLQVVLEAPLALKRDRQSDRSETVQSIPGTTLRGALAALYLQQHGEADPEFQRLFVQSGYCRFGPLDPARNIYPLSMTACKRRRNDHPKVDQLANRIALHFTNGAISQTVGKHLYECPVEGCGSDLQKCVGFFEVLGNRMRDRSSHIHVAAHVGIDRLTDTAADGVFYTLDAIAPLAPPEEAPSDQTQPGANQGARRQSNGRLQSLSPTRLYGWLDATDDAIQAVRQLLQRENNILFLGHHRTRGYGRVRVVIDEKPEEEAAADEQRWGQWSETIIRFVNDAIASHDSEASACRLAPENDFIFALSLPTGAILVDRLLRYTPDLADVISWLPPLPNIDCLFPVSERPVARIGQSGEVRCVLAITQQQLVRGWNAAHGLPKQDEWMVARGSVYVYWFRGSADDRAELIHRLQQLRRAGVGLRRSEGYGQFVVNDPIHVQAMPGVQGEPKWQR